MIGVILMSNFKKLLFILIFILIIEIIFIFTKHKMSPGRDTLEYNNLLCKSYHTNLLWYK